MTLPGFLQTQLASIREVGQSPEATMRTGIASTIPTMVADRMEGPILQWKKISFLSVTGNRARSFATSHHSSVIRQCLPQSLVAAQIKSLSGEPSLSLKPISGRSEFLTQQGSIVWLFEQRSQTREVPFCCFAVGHEGRSPEPNLLQQ